LSIFDGWWIEGYNGKNGWAFGDKEGNRNNNEDASGVYELLEKKIVPLYYDIDDDGLPSKWIKLMKEAIKSTAAPFSARRMMKEYAKKFYHPAFDFASRTQIINKAE
jgi:starch phosphorylase